MNVINYQKKLDELLSEIKTKQTMPKLLLHSCCAPCSSYCLLYLAQYFEITVFYFNPNIYPQDEYIKRASEQKRLIETLNRENHYSISYLEGDYHPEVFFELSKGLEQAPEGGERCMKCYEYRLRESVKIAKQNGFDYFTTTLTISPLKNAARINEIGEQIGREMGVLHLPSDFKKKDGYKQSVQLSEKYGLYRQNYCGCVYSRRQKSETENAK